MRSIKHKKGSLSLKPHSCKIQLLNVRSYYILKTITLAVVYCGKYRPEAPATTHELHTPKMNESVYRVIKI